MFQDCVLHLSEYLLQKSPLHEAKDRMPIRRGRFAPQNTFLETIAQKFDRGSK